MAASATSAAKSIARFPKRKYAILFGYSGQGYFGLQIQPSQPDVRTIEGELISALGKTGVITPDITEQIQRASWTRAARTDKGVHALGQVVALKMRLAVPDEQASSSIEAKASEASAASASAASADDDSAKETDARRILVSQLNELLPKQIRIFDCLRITNSFSAQNACTGRFYEYLLPTYMLAKNQRVWDIVEQVKQEHVAAAVAQLVEAGGKAEDLAEAECVSRAKGFTADALARVKETLGQDEVRPATEELGGNATAEEVAAWLKARRERIQGYRSTADDRARLNEALGCFVGTHKYHNYTSQLRPSDQQANRYILSFEAQGPEVVHGVEMLRLVVHGQSFVLNQIRKMVGMAVEVTRRGLEPTTVIAKSFEPRGMEVPMAPAAGLLLHSTLFAKYNSSLEKLRKTGTSAAQPVNFAESESLCAQQRALASETVYPAMVEEDSEHSRFVEHIAMWDLESFPRWRAVDHEWATKNSRVVIAQREYKQGGYLKGKRMRNYKGADADANEAKLARVEHELREADEFVFRDQLADADAAGTK